MYRDIELYIIDIFIAIDKINRYTNRFDNAQDFLDSELEWDGTIRELEIIGEATNHLLKSNIVSNEYRRIVDFRNQISHGYFGIDENIVFYVVKNKLDRYFEDLINISKTKQDTILLAIQSAKKENARNKNILTLLDNLVHLLS